MRKNSIIILSLCFLFFNLISSNITLFAKDSQTIKITGPWYYTYDDIDGSKIEFSKPEFNVKNWENIILPIGAFNLDISKNRYIWFRTTFKIPINYKDKVLALFMGKIPAAAKIYINGYLIAING